MCHSLELGLPWWLSQWRICLQCRKPGFDSWVGKIPWRRKWQPTPAFLPGGFHGERSLAGYSHWDHKVGHNWATNTFTFPSPLMKAKPQGVNTSRFISYSSMNIERILWYLMTCPIEAFQQKERTAQCWPEAMCFQVTLERIWLKSSGDLKSCEV